MPEFESNQTKYKKISMDSIVKSVQDKLISKNEFPSFSAGDTLTVTIEIREGDKVRPQSFKGVVIQVKGRGTSKTFTIRKSPVLSELREFLH